MDLIQLQMEVHQYAISKGFWEHDHGSHEVDGEKIALMHSELSEALDALRDRDWEQVENELADTVIRILDYCERRGLSIVRGIETVRAKAEGREYLHGRKWF